MMKTVIATISLLLSGWPAAPLTAVPQARPVALTHVTVIDVTGGPSRSDMTVIVEGSRIAAVAPTGKVAVPQNAHVIDARGKFLIPGLWDMHVHALIQPREETFLQLFIANGVTGIRDMATRTALAEVSRWKKEIENRARVGPRILTSGRILDGPVPVNPTLSIPIKDPTEGRNAVRLLKEQGADFIKVYSRLSRDAFYAIADEARKQKLPIAGHVPTSVTACEASAAGQRSLEHLLVWTWLEGCSPEEAERRQKAVDESSPISGILRQVDAVESYDEKRAKALVDVFVKRDTWLTPTLAARESASHFDEKLSSNDPRLRYMIPEIKALWKGSFFTKFTPEQLVRLKAGFPKQLEFIANMQRFGARFLAGTDAGVPYAFPGFSLHDELALFVKAGMTPLAALQTATINPATFLGRQKELGSVESGKLADLVLLDADPLANISNTRRISAVIANGRFFDRTTMDKMLLEVEALANKK